jgi:hypothetical protein
MYNFPENVIVIPTLEAEGYPGVHKFPFGNITTYALPNNGLVAKADDLIYTSGHYVSGDGVSDFASTAYTSDFGVAGKTWQYKFKVRLTAKPPAAEAIYSTGWNNGGFMFYINASGYLTFLSKQAGSASNYFSGAVAQDLSDGVWHDIIVSGTGGLWESASIDGQTKSIIVNTPETGTYGDRGSLVTVFAANTPGSTGNFFAGDLADIHITIDGTLVASWLMGSNENGTAQGKPEYDRSGNRHHLYYTGCTAVSGEGAPIPQTGLMDWNRRALFYADDYVKTTSGFNINSGTKSLRLTFSRTFTPDLGDDENLLSQENGTGIGRTILYYNGTLKKLFSYLGGTARNLGLSVEDHKIYNISISFSEEISTTLVVFSESNEPFATFSIPKENATGSFRIGVNKNGEAGFRGIISDVSGYDGDPYGPNSFSYRGYGNAHADWLDQLGSNNGLLFGYPISEVIIPQQITNGAIDGLGFLISNPRKNLLNHTGWEGDRAVIPDSPGLDVTTEAEWFIWGNFYINDGIPQIRRFVDRWDAPINSERCFMFYRAPTDPNDPGLVRVLLSSDGTALSNFKFTVSNAHSLIRIQYNASAGTLKWAEYNNGSWSALTNADLDYGSFPSSLHPTNIPIYLPGTFDTSSPEEHWAGQQSPLWMYNRILTDDEADDLRKATQSTYGTP